MSKPFATSHARAHLERFPACLYVDHLLSKWQWQVSAHFTIHMASSVTEVIQQNCAIASSHTMCTAIMIAETGRHKIRCQITKPTKLE
eukprot:3821034-Amphidinium_carterae.1